ncbi:MAG: HlyD family efflux transporter periplasmic adaptor subunit [Chlorobium sp.]|uniref:efflux RND transporter periplasmic adaptor subunit n=1 Tax=Chlorobium sp. TaxID=1095 RepID=UPI0025BE02C4|nr:HlyD family efflux transporter periplasmic adaptor subunit [Chlorobium sp.]MCF8215269.1 HlyD family efflux transporter periplasmic adaptor subunit [Chlorobium sp.]MCF8270105.1 HlyD family efflux transporter periplasmic adaptor subunit [Chlorobium sp.]MCF8286475.1 HlyD family efflux transporter periplasmic adaptor subunit [Chlorobium sp.]MCF8290074.1 HlyD family efflux transporter periplasmic adaptor subunit [Chlorobium sp.]MCF8384145.1 HlyD family efflux transporter periplasmic adaptor subu
MIGEKNKSIVIALGISFLVAITAAFFVFRGGDRTKESYTEIRVKRGSIVSSVSTTGVVEPRNRLKIKPSIAGRIEEIRVEEGQMVRKGQVMALLSSMERAALLDAAKLQGDREHSYWQNVYRASTVIAPIDGQVIVRSIEPGQTVTTSDSLFVLSDRLIVKAYVDETDIGKVRIGQKTVIGLDAYPEIRVKGVIEHIHYESHLQNNVTIYTVDVIPETIPDVFRSGMSANIDILVIEKKDALLLSSAAVSSRNGRSIVWLKNEESKLGMISRAVRTGIQDENNIEILDGVDEGAVVLLREASFSLPENRGGSNPFMPQRNRIAK